MQTILMVLLSLVSVAQAKSNFDQSYKSWDELLKKNVVLTEHSSQVRYSKIDLEALNQFLSSIQAVSKSDYQSWSGDQRLAFLINAYNAFTVKWILQNKIPDSIKDTGSFFSSPWKKKFFDLLGEKASLDYVEHDLARATFNNCRLHFAFNCASVGCPMLRNEAWLPEKLKTQFEDSAKHFLEDPSRNTYVAKDNSLELSQIFNWYGKDFDKDPTCGGVKNFVRKYMTQNSKPIPESALVKFQPYDWHLNKAEK